jgi:hypothetical protein
MRANQDSALDFSTGSPGCCRSLIPGIVIVHDQDVDPLIGKNELRAARPLPPLKVVRIRHLRRDLPQAVFRKLRLAQDQDPMDGWHIFE